ncbi:MAG: hypothetical protein RLZZ219_926 [Cyanobacteriota bacterium]
MVLKPLPLRALLVLAAFGSCSLFASVPSDGWHPLGVLASLLPLQLAALFWALSRGASPAVESLRPEAALRPADRRLPASAGWGPAAGSDDG